jgi:hypothetical protein
VAWFAIKQTKRDETAQTSVAIFLDLVRGHCR